ncbi:MAG: hypothetical protein HQL75_00270 [Magnetococcales bacterium]|nr:hypothetical protein [Magnetococcales bacterium]
MATQQSFVGEGTIYLGLASGGQLREVGQVSEFKVDVSTEEKELKNYQGGGGIADSISMISKVEASLNFKSFSKENLALALRGTTADLASGAVVNESHSAYLNGYIPLAGVGPTAVTVTVDAPAWGALAVKAKGDVVFDGTHFYRATVAGTTGALAPVWPTDGTTVVDGTVTWKDAGLIAVAASEFTIKSAGIYIPETSTKFAATATPIKINYTKTAGINLQALVNAGFEYRIFFDGTNFANEGSPVTMDLFRAKFSPTKDLSMLGDDFAGLTLTASVLKDPTKTTTGDSQFFEMKMVE